MNIIDKYFLIHTNLSGKEIYLENQKMYFFIFVQSLFIVFTKFLTVICILVMCFQSCFYHNISYNF